MGSEMKVFSYPWMAQDTDISVCAHIAVWSIINYYAHRYPNYKISPIGEIADNTPQYLSRKTPSEGLNLLQVSELLSNSGFYPLVLKKRNNQDQDFFRAIYSYIESGIPMVAAMTGKEHAVAIIGHGDINTGKLSTHMDDLIYCADLVDEYIISNDNELPFTCVSRYGHEYSFNDLDYVIIPLYEKMYLNSHIVYKRVESLINAGVLNINEPVVLRVYLTSTRSLKREALKNRSMNDVLKSTMLKLHTPQFVWCADISTTNDYNEKHTTFRIIIDSTAGTYEDDPWLLIHDDEKIVYRDENKVFKIDQNIQPYEMYVNNLKEVAKNES